MSFERERVKDTTTPLPFSFLQTSNCLSGKGVVLAVAAATDCTRRYKHVGERWKEEEYFGLGPDRLKMKLEEREESEEENFPPINY